MKKLMLTLTLLIAIAALIPATADAGKSVLEMATSISFGLGSARYQGNGTGLWAAEVEVHAQPWTWGWLQGDPSCPATDLLFASAYYRGDELIETAAWGGDRVGIRAGMSICPAAAYELGQFRLFADASSAGLGAGVAVRLYILNVQADLLSKSIIGGVVIPLRLVHKGKVVTEYF